MRDFAGLLKIAGLSKSASPFLRRLAAMPNAKMTPKIVHAILGESPDALRNGSFFVGKPVSIPSWLLRGIRKVHL